MTKLRSGRKVVGMQQMTSHCLLSSFYLGTYMHTGGINIYSQLVISAFRIADINHCFQLVQSSIVDISN